MFLPCWSSRTWFFFILFPSFTGLDYVGSLICHWLIPFFLRREYPVNLWSISYLFKLGNGCFLFTRIWATNTVAYFCWSKELLFTFWLVCLKFYILENWLAWSLCSLSKLYKFDMVYVQRLDFKFPLSVSCIHFICSSIGAYLVIKVLKLKPLIVVDPEDRWRRIFPMSFVFCINIVLGNISLRYIPVSFMQTIKSFTPATTGQPQKSST